VSVLYLYRSGSKVGGERVYVVCVKVEARWEENVSVSYLCRSRSKVGGECVEVERRMC
jgi:hypothetical protein